MIRRYLNQLQLTAQTSSLLAVLAKECKMATQREPSMSELHLQIQHTIYMRDVMKDKWQNDHTVHGSISKHSALKLIEEHLAELENQLCEAELRYRFRNESV